jgi:Xaa-Pro dipeptidase
VTDRRQRVQEAIRGSSFDAVLLVAPANLAYVSGFRPTPYERLVALVVPAAGPLQLVVPSLEEQAAREELPGGTELHVWRDEAGPAGALTAALSGAGGRIGIEKAHLTVAYQELVLTALRSTADLRDCGPLLAGLRLVKDEEEVARLRRAAQIIDRVVERLAPEIVPGRSEAELADLAGRLIREEGGDGPSFPPTVLAGAKSALPHGSPDGTPIAAGDLVIVDVGASYQGYCSDITRTFVAGREPDERQRELFGVVRDAQASAVRAAVAGATGADIDRAARSVIEAAGLGELFVHRTGHGLGLEVHEQPSLHAAADEPLPEGAVATVEPGIYVPGYGGVRIEDDVVVRAGSPDVLTRAPTALRA